MKLPFVFAKRFVAGESFRKAVPKVEELNKLGIKVTLDLLGENVKDRKTCVQTRDEYIELLRKIEDEGLASTISIKLTMMGLDIDEDFCRENLFALLDVAAKQNQFVRIDMEGSDFTQSTIDVFKEAHKKYGNKHVGLVIQAYLHRTQKDIEALAELGADIRLCKGAYKEPADLAIPDMAGIREAFKTCAEVLVSKTDYPRIATHDDELVLFMKDYAKRNNIPKDRFEFQMLYGLRQQTCEDLVKEGYNVRVYVPYGTEWFPYFSRRLSERKENIWFVLSHMFKS
jgi:proline dehydrogenase